MFLLNLFHIALYLIDHLPNLFHLERIRNRARSFIYVYSSMKVHQQNKHLLKVNRCIPLITQIDLSANSQVMFALNKPSVLSDIDKCINIRDARKPRWFKQNNSNTVSEQNMKCLNHTFFFISFIIRWQNSLII